MPRWGGRAQTALMCTSTTHPVLRLTRCCAASTCTRASRFAATASFASWDPWNTGPRPERHLLVKRATMRGFLATDFADRYEEAIAALAGWIRAGQLKFREDIREGIQCAPGLIETLYTGDNSGKLLVHLRSDAGAVDVEA